MNIYQNNNYRKRLSWLHFDNEPVLHFCFSSLSNNFNLQLEAITRTWQQYSMHGHMIDLQRYRATSGERNFIEQTNPPIFLENRDNVRALIQFRKESQLQHLKRWFFLKKRCTHSHINSTSVIRLIKWNKLSFYSIYFNKPLPALNQCLVDQIQAQKPILAVATDQMPDHTWIESSIISIDSNIKTTSSGGATCWTIFL